MSMSIYTAQLRNTSNALSPGMSNKQICLQIPPKLFGVDSWIPQIIGQWIPDCWSGYRQARVPKVPQRTRGTDSRWRLADVCVAYTANSCKVWTDDEKREVCRQSLKTSTVLC